MKNVSKIIFVLCLGIFLSSGRNANAQNDSTFTYSGSINTWTVPSCVNKITITAIGATGGNVTGYTPVGGNGAKMVGTFTVTAGEGLKILVGGAGGSGFTAGGGGGGTFVTDNSNNPLIVAGGGGGVDVFNNVWTSVGIDAVVTMDGENGYSTLGGSPNNYGIGGTGGNGATNNGFGPCAGNGGGLLSNGAQPSCCYGTSGYGFVNGGAGGNGCTSNSGNGGFGGGGGGGNTGGGGGGGYGGGGGSYNDPVNGGGGGSYNAGSNQTDIAAFNAAGNGVVTISWVVDSIVTVTGNVVQNMSCYGSNNAMAAAVVNGGAEPSNLFTYSWAPGGQTTDTIGALSAGTYTVTASAFCGLSKTATVTITQPTVLAVNDIVVNNVSCYNGNDGVLFANVSGGTSPYAYSWTGGGGTNATATGLSAGIYKVTVTDSRGCMGVASATITQPNMLVANTSVTSIASCGANNGSISSTVGGGTSPYGYSWTNGGTNSSVSGLSGGSYTLTVTDFNGCSATSVATVGSTPAVSISASTASNNACNGNASGSAVSNVIGGTAPFTYFWSGGAGNSFTAAGLVAGTYTVSVTDINGCTSSATTTITQPSPMNVVSDSTPADAGCSGSAWVVVSGGTSPYNYLWSNGTTTDYVSNECKGTYCCTVTDAHGCFETTCIKITSTTGVADLSTSAQITIYPNPNNGQFTISTSGVIGKSVMEVYNILGETVYTTELKSGANNVNISNQPNGVYLYKIISASGSQLGTGKVILQK